MRPQKTQLAAGIMIFSETSNFNRVLYSMFGYQEYKALLIGGRGGRSGRANGRTISGKTSWVDKSGGGGGGGLMIKGKLIDLGAQSLVTVGAAGGDGSDSTNGVKASNGSVGGTTSFAGKSAFGGKGGVGGKYDITAGGNATITRGQGGDGGSNSSGYGTPGTGGRSASAEGDFGGIIGASSSILPTDGTASTGHTGDVVDGTCGGGGGAGRVRLFDDYQGPADGGASGGIGFETYDAPGSPADNGSGSPGSVIGGFGGGCNAYPILNYISFYGGGYIGGGVVILQVS